MTEEPIIRHIKHKEPDGSTHEGISIRWKRDGYINPNTTVIEPKPEVTPREEKPIPKPEVKVSDRLNITLKDGKTHHIEKTENGIIVYLTEKERFKLDNPNRVKWRLTDERRRKQDLNLIRNGKIIPLSKILKMEGVLN